MAEEEEAGSQKAKNVEAKIGWLEARVATGMQVKMDRVQKMTLDDNYRRYIIDFLDHPESKRLFIWEDNNNLMCNIHPPTGFKKKSMYMAKSPIQKESTKLGDNIICGDFSMNPLDSLSTVAQEVFFPLLTNQRNQEGWPEVVTREVTESLYKFLQNLTVTVGHTKGQTVLPLPPTDVSAPVSSGRDKDRVHLMESAVVTWTRQIKNVLKTDPEAELKAGLNPGPSVELEFWLEKARNLNSLHKQLFGDKIRKVIYLLQSTKSTYYLAFDRLTKEVAQARIEANSNIVHLRPLRELLSALSTDDFPDLMPLFKPIMHTILLIWKNSKYYNSPARLVVLMREICNDLIAQACKFVNGETLFELEPQDAVDNLKLALKVCRTFKSTYFDYKGRAGTDCPSNPWRFQNSAIFARLDSFLERCHDVLDLTQTIVQFSKLEKIEIGGTKGKTLTTSVRQIYDDFLEAVKKFQTAEYEIVNVEAKQFDDDFYTFRCQINELERRLGSVITQAFDDCTTVFGCFKLLDSFEGLLEREIIQTDLEKKNVDLLNSYSADLKQVQELFMVGKDNPPINDNMPPKAGAVNWCRGLVERVEDPMNRLKSMGKAILETEEGKEVIRVYNAIMTSLQEYEHQKVDDWAKEIENTSQEKLKQALLRREEENNFLHVNFDPALVCLLREVKYFLLLNIEVPESAMTIYKKAETFRQQTGNLELIVNIYNRVLATLIDVERPLVQNKLDNIDKVLQKGLKHLNWKSHSIPEFIQQTMSIVKDTSQVLTTIKSNVQSIHKVLKAWSELPLMDRKTVKTYSLDEFEASHKALLGTRYNEIKEGTEHIHNALQNSNKVLKVSKNASAWKAYTDYVNNIVVEGIAAVITASQQYLKRQVDSAYMLQNDINPLLEVKLKLIAPDIHFVPEMGLTPEGQIMADGIRDIANKWCQGFINVATLMRRLDTGDGDYLNDMQEDIEVKALAAQINSLVEANEAQCLQFMLSYEKFSYLWTNDLKEHFQEFLSHPNEFGAKVPSLTEFDEQIGKYKAIEEEIAQLPTTKQIGWLKVDAKPIRNSLQQWATKWSLMFKEYLLNRVNNTMEELMQFIDKVNDNMDREVESDDSVTLLEIMGFIRDVRVRSDETDEMFDPLRATVNLLKRYDISVTDLVLKQLDEAPMNWSNVKKKTFRTKERLSQLQSDEAEKLKVKVQKFDERVSEFRRMFKETMPYNYSVNHDAAYELLDRAHHGEVTHENPWGSVKSIEAESRELNEKQELFELNVTEYKEIKNCTAELKLLKNLWDMVAIVLNQFTEWKRTKWDEIDVEYLSEQTKNLMKEVKALHKNVKNWGGYEGLEADVKNLSTSLPLVSDLHHPSMRERHWNKLMQITGVKFVMDDKFTLGSLLSLNLHHHVDQVAEIVDIAKKELIIEKSLIKIKDTWTDLRLGFEAYEDSDTFTLTIPEEVIEALEDNVLQLQNMQSSKYVVNNPVFMRDVTEWQHKLGAVESVVNSWLEVQKKWTNLQSIFVGSADIRIQLPEDSKRFDAVDVDWKDLMKEASFVPNVVEACNQEGRLDRIERMLEMLEKCEKALADYLETKRVAFPRFYFVAPADLLDILSKGSNPQLVMRHLPKCFDNVHALEFEKDADGNPTKTAIGMYSGEKEYVVFDKPRICEGAVEVWLQELVVSMRNALRVVLTESLSAYEDKPRTEWLYDFAAQIATVVSRVVWTEEVNLVFEQLEDGNEGVLKEYLRKLQDQLTNLTELVLKDLTSNDRKKIITLITTEVHARDVVNKLVNERVENNQCFQWVSQLRYGIEEKSKECKINICDFDTLYGYEYIGNCGCLVITPLTDRCYITLTQASRLILGGAPSGPAGTGKTETVKDLGRALGRMVYVFNCSDQMDYKSMGQIYKGLAQAGAWGCFDEFNRIPIEVLSVCSTQVKCVLDAIRGNKKKFVFEEEEITLEWRPLCMAFITMNPGYAGRTELPENLKALFRPVAMIVPDMDMITEIMLMSEGFADGRVLARKFMILYRLCQDLLSAQDHYDWKLRAIKTTLNVAGGMRRQDPNNTEDKVLLRALRDFNIGKLVADDVGIFMGLLNDLFPKTLELVVRNRDLAFEEKIKEGAKLLNLQPEDTFVLKISQLRELLVVRWSVFMLGPAGSGKTEAIKVLAKAQNLFGEKTTMHTLNPKAVTRNELYGYIHPATREWKDGLISQIFRDLANTHNVPHEWIVLDGDIDAEWIESMNTVMDDNKMLTLASNERIPLTGPMRLLFEVGDLRNASPATVSRGGVIFINDTDIGWNPFVQSWIEARQVEGERSQLTSLFGNYVTKSLEHIRKTFKMIIPMTEINMVKTICFLLEGLLLDCEAQTGHSASVDAKILEALFVLAAVWGFGSALLVDKQTDNRNIFDKWWREEWKSVRFPDAGMVFDYNVDFTGKITPWTEMVPNFVHQPDLPFGNIYVPTANTFRLSFFLDILMRNRHPVMFVGNAGTGKTCIMKEKLRSLDAESLASLMINLNCFTDSMSLQTTMEQVIEKKTGRVFGPPGTKRLIYFIDDFNMPAVDKYGTQQPIALLRQHMDYNSWYDRGKMTLKEIHNCQYIACMNPTAGSFTVDTRIQRHFSTFAVQAPDQAALNAIYHSILAGHLANFNPSVSKYAEKLVKATLELHKGVSETFLPTAIKFHYLFNLRDLSNVIQGMCLALPDYYSDTLSISRLWVHEVERVFSDRLVTESDLARFQEMLGEVIKKNLDDNSVDKTLERPIIFTDFTVFTSDDSKPYVAAPELPKLKKILEDKLEEYNETNAAMKLVLFDAAVEHVCRIVRIIAQPRGNALAVGVGGSGKQSLARLSAHICGYEVFQITVTQTYGVADFKADLIALYQRSGVKGIGMCFLLTDGQIVDDRFLVFLNDMLASGDIPDLFTTEEKDDINNSVRGEVKQAGLPDTKENLWEFFIEKVRTLLHCVICFSPVGERFRVAARQFPALINCTVIDWFQGWPQEALMQVASVFLRDIDNIDPDVCENIALHMSFAHTCVDQASHEFLERERRYNYTTPKSFLELIALYKSLLARKRGEIAALKTRLESGLDKLKSTAAQVADLQANLKVEQVAVEEKKAVAEGIMKQVVQEQEIAMEEKEKASVEEEKCNVIASEVSAFAAECSADLAAAEPLLAEAELALAGIAKKDLAELKALANPVAEIVQVFAALMTLTAPGGKIPKDLSWNAGKKVMANVDRLMSELASFDRDNIPEVSCATVEKLYMSNPNFNKEYVSGKSAAAAGLCSWIVNMCKYFRIFQSVAPKRAKLQEANEKLAAANAKLKQVRDKVAELEARLQDLTDKLNAATEEKNGAIARAEETQKRADLAQRLVNGLADENVRWALQVEQFGVQERSLVGDVLVASAFVSYIGAFSAEFRRSLVTDKWVPDVMEKKIPSTEGITPLAVLTDEAEIAGWINDGLPSDPVSVQNGAILSATKRWPLLIDPQLQGVTYVINKETKNGLRTVQQSQNRYLDEIEKAIINGEPVLLENLGENIDAVLEPLIGRSILTRNGAMFIKMGDKEVDYDERFRLYLQTRLSNPHYKPEIAAQTTLINFMVTLSGLEDQLLALVVNKERIDLEEQRQGLLKDQNQFKITLKELEDNLLMRLANAPEDVLSDIELIENLEFTKKTAKEIEEKVVEAKETEKNINEAREGYRPVAIRGALLYFLVDSLWILDHMYQYSMANFVVIMSKGMDKAEPADDLAARIQNLIKSSSFVVFRYVSQGLFERHKLILGTQLTMRILFRAGQLDHELFDFLIRGPKATGNDENPLAEWLPLATWNAIQALREIEVFENLPSDMESSAKRFREWIELERPEEMPLPGDWKKLSEFHRLLVIRCLRPDRMTDAMAGFVVRSLGYGMTVPFDLEAAFEDARPDTPIFFILSPGVDPVKDVEILGKKLGFTSDLGKVTYVSLGQGQEPVAQKALQTAHKFGGWVFLQNIHLTPGWTSGYLQKELDKIAEGAHAEFRLYLSADPSPAMPVSILQQSVKLTNEPPEGLRANLIRAWASFQDDFFENCNKQAELRGIVFALSFFHAVVIERKKFGAQGWNRGYPFNSGDLVNSAHVCFNYLENNQKIPWDDLRYMFGEIMYGGHITDDWDRRLCGNYLLTFIKEELIEGMDLFPSFPTPPSGTNCQGVMQYIDEVMPTESPVAFGLHPNAEINFCLEQAESLFRNIMELQPRSASAGDGMSLQDKAKMVLDDITDKMPESFNMLEILEKVEDRSPYTNVFLQEIERMNALLEVMSRSLFELDLGLKGDLTISPAMEALMGCLSEDRMPEVWEKKAYPSLRPLASWFNNLIQRHKQLQEWTTDLVLPKVTWLSGLFNPQSFLTAVMQTTARRSDWPLDKTVIQTDVTKKTIEDIAAPSRDGAFVSGMVLEGARWDEKAGAGTLEDSRPKELFGTMPVILIKAVTVDKAELRDVYLCPVYKTQKRGPTYVFTAGLRTKANPTKWVLAGVALLMDVVLV